MYDEFLEKSRKRAANRVVGDPFLGGIEQGPQVSELELELLVFPFELQVKQHVLGCLLKSK